MKKYSILFLLFLSQIVLMDAQTFTYKGKNLYGIQEYVKDSLQRATNLMFYDMDGDGDQDLILSGIDSIKYDKTGNVTSFSQVTYFISVQENIGSKWIPKFAARKPFMESFPFRKGYFYPTVGDLNDDHKLDFVVSSGLDSNYNMTTLFYDRKETTGKDQFNITSGDQIGLDPFISGSFFTPYLADMDKDGDLDLFMSGYFLERTTSGEKVQRPVFLYAKNTGTKSNPVFIGWYENTNGLDKSLGDLQLITIGDIDNDKDNDIISLTNANNISKLSFLENVSRPDGKADFKLSKPLSGIPSTMSGERYYTPALVDIDGDGDLDLFMLQDLSKTSTGIGFYENNYCKAITTQISRNICEGDSIIVGTQKFSQAGQFDVKLQANNKCDSIVKMNLTVYPKATTNVTKTFCSGDVFTIGTEKFTQTGKYVVKLKSAKGCDSIIQASLTFVILNNAVSQFQNKLTAAQNGVSYQWFDCNTNLDIIGAIGQSFSPTKNGKYGVKLTDSNGCHNISSCVDFTMTAVEDWILSDHIILSPNPAANYLAISNQTGFTLNSIRIINLEGKLLMIVPCQQMTRFSTAELKPGNYIMEIQCNGSKIFKQFEIAR